eukprot:TRINITY_DN3672_c0_g1_i2.p1 TRINITY_DN3672_c0_g1~~TRINITY_DN3672_c0_g1_i2.p1  ORF type:complete len:187 (+),score=31.90 TRINITY_DN3672_c0_g1_i2:64-624(+)
MCIRDRYMGSISKFDMLLKYLEILNAKNIILASKSSGRRQVLDLLKLKYECYPSDFAEDLRKEDFARPVDYVRETCLGKMNDVYKKLHKNKKDFDLIICADTVCIFKDRIIEKPADHEEAYQIIKAFANEKHEVISVIYILVRIDPNPDAPIENQLVAWAPESTIVEFGDISEDAIKFFAATDAPL